MSNMPLRNFFNSNREEIKNFNWRILKRLTSKEFCITGRYSKAGRNSRVRPLETLRRRWDDEVRIICSEVFHFFLSTIRHTLYGNRIHLHQGRTDICTQRIIATCTCTIFNLLKTNPIITALPTLYHIYVYNFDQNLHCWYHNICLLIVTCSIAVCSKNIMVSASWRWRDINAETCRSYVKDSMYKLLNNAFVGVIWVIYFTL